MIKSIKTSLLFDICDFVIVNHPIDSFTNKIYVQAFKDLRIFLESSNSAYDIKQFLKKKELEK